MLEVQPYLANIPIPILPWLVLYQCYILNIPLAAGFSARVLLLFLVK